MAYIKKTRVQDVCSGSGTGALNLANTPPTSYRALQAVMANGDTAVVEIRDQASGLWEESLITFNAGSPNTVTRTAVLDGSAGPGTLVSFGAGNKDIYIAASPYRVLQEDDGGNAALAGGSVTAVLDTLAAMKALTVRPATVLLKGLSSPGDGGDGLFRWVAGDGSTADDATIVQPTAGAAGRYKRSYKPQYIDARWFGLKADNATDDTVAFQKAATFVMSIGGGALHLPAGTTRVTSTVSFLNPAQGRLGAVRIVGAGRDITIIDGRLASDGPILDIRGIPSGVMATSSYIAGGGIEDLTVSGANATAAHVIGIRHLGWNTPVWRGVHVTNTSSHNVVSESDLTWDSNPDQSASQSGIYDGCLFERSGGYNYYNSTNEGSQDFLMLSTVLSFGYSGGILLNSNYWRFINSSFVNAGWATEAGTVNPSNAYGIELSRSDRTFIEQCEFGPNKTAHIGLSRVRDSVIQNNRWINQDHFNTGVVTPPYMVAMMIYGSGYQNDSNLIQNNFVRCDPLEHGTASPTITIFKNLNPGGDVTNLVARHHSIEDNVGGGTTIIPENGFTASDRAYLYNNTIIVEAPVFPALTTIVQGWSLPYIHTYIDNPASVPTSFGIVPLKNLLGPNSGVGAPWTASYNKTTYTFTAPQRGKYRVRIAFNIDSGFAVDNNYRLELRKNGSAERGWFLTGNNTGSYTGQCYREVSYDLTLAAGDTLTVFGNVSSGSLTYLAFDVIYQMLFGW